jgi:hypothetical protein
MGASSSSASKSGACPGKDIPIAVRKVFERFDKDNSGNLDVEEIKAGLSVVLGADVPDDKLHLLLGEHDSDGSGEFTIEEFEVLIEAIHDMADKEKKAEPPIKMHEGSILGQNRKLPYQDATLLAYTNKFVAGFVAFCIVANFGINILEKQIDPDTEHMKYEAFWNNADVTLNIIFLFELIANMYSYGGPVKAFWRSGWNVFDTIIVTVGVLTMVNVLGPPLDKLKLMRAFRVFRLFKRVESLNKIIVALINSIPGVINAFVVMLVFFCIYAILAVELFRDFGAGGIFTTFDSTTGKNVTLDSISGRGYVHGIEYYGTFMRALYTLFQVMTGESWSEAVARPLIFGLYQNDAIVVGFFFVSFIILTQIVLINVVVAVLLDSFCANQDDGGEEDAAVDARLASLENKDAMAAINAKLDQIGSVGNGASATPDSSAVMLEKLLSKISTIDTLACSVTQLNATVADLKSQIQAMERKLPAKVLANF